jgi:hypothetical protein
MRWLWLLPEHLDRGRRRAPLFGLFTQGNHGHL